MPFHKENESKGNFLMSPTNAKPLYQVSAPRTVMVPYTSPDGYHIPTGNWLAIPQLSLMRDESIWPRALAFEGFRFVDENGMSESRLTHPSYEFPFWGSIRHAWWASSIASARAPLLVPSPSMPPFFHKRPGARQLTHAGLMLCSLQCPNS